MKKNKKQNTVRVTDYSEGFLAGRKIGHSEGYELGLIKGYERAMSDVADYVIGKMEVKK